MAHTDKSENLVWIDLEMSGLDAARDVILEVATIITTSNLEIIETGPNIVIHQEEKLFETMDDWNKKHHTQSGLWQKVLESKTSMEEAETLTLDFIKKHTLPNQSPLCGNTIYQDRIFLSKYFKKVDEHLHYRLIDVSTIKELVKRWAPNGKKAPTKKGDHRALSDIIESIEELRFYRDNYINIPT